MPGYMASKVLGVSVSNSSTKGALYCPIILGSDKMTVLVATDQVKYHPLYISIGNPHNSVRCTHQNAVIPIAFLAIPKSESPCFWLSGFEHAQSYNTSGDRWYDKCPHFRAFKRQLYHVSIAAILKPLRLGMTDPIVRRCLDGHLRRVIYDLVAFCYGRLAVVSDLDDGGFALDVDKELRGSAVL
jgi:hypothetical protein